MPSNSANSNSLLQTHTASALRKVVEFCKLWMTYVTNSEKLPKDAINKNGYHKNCSFTSKLLFRIIKIIFDIQVKKG